MYLDLKLKLVNLVTLQETSEVVDGEISEGEEEVDFLIVEEEVKAFWIKASLDLACGGKVVHEGFHVLWL